MAPLKAMQLPEHLADAAAAPLCVLLGDDDALRAQSLHLLKEAAAPADQPGSTLREFEGSPEARDVFDELHTVPFLGLAGRRVVVITGADAFLAERDPCGPPDRPEVNEGDHGKSGCDEPSAAKGRRGVAVERVHDKNRRGIPKDSRILKEYDSQVRHRIKQDDEQRGYHIKEERAMRRLGMVRHG